MNPGADEQRGDATDDDCDGSTQIRRDFVSGLAGGSAADFTYQTSQRWPAVGLQDGVKVSSGLPLTWKRTPTWQSADVHISIHAVETTQGASCQLKVVSGASTWYYAVVEGDNDAHVAGVDPGQVLTEVRVQCSGGSLVVDWFTVQNGATFVAPIQDITADGWQSMYTPGRNQGPTFARTDENGEYMFVATQAGFAWSSDLTSWHMANGTREDLVSSDYLLFHEAVAIWPGPFDAWPDVWAIVAGTEGDGGNDHDGIWWSNDLGASWSREVAGFYSARVHSDCPDDAGRADFHRAASGRLMLRDPLSSGFYALENGDAALEPDRGLYIHNGKTGAPGKYCRVGRDSLPSNRGAALEIVEDGAGNPILIVGYRVAPGNVPPFHPEDSATLYACTLANADCGPIRGDPTNGGDCLPIADDVGDLIQVDVRDIVADPSVGDEGILYVADGGYRGTVTNLITNEPACEWDPTERDTTVWRVDLGGVDVEQVIADHLSDPAEPAFITAFAEDTDPMDPENHREPWWLPLGPGSLTPEFGNGCGITTYDGDLITLMPGESLGSVTTLAIDPAGDFLFATSSLAVGAGSGGGRNYSCPTLFRLDLNDTEPAWEPMSEWDVADAFVEDNRQQRLSVTSADPDAVADEPILESFTDRTLSALTFFGGPVDPDLYLGGYFGWIVPALAYPTLLQPCGVGWNADFDLFDPDCVIHDLAWSDDVDGFDIYDPNQLAVCHGCAESSGELVDYVATVGGQTTGFAAYGEDSTGHREASDLDCHWTMLQSGAHAQAIWEDPDGVERPQLWSAFAGLNRGIVFAEWDDESDPGWDEDRIDDLSVDLQRKGWSNEGYGTPCWDGYPSSLLGNFAHPAELVGDGSLGALHDVWECSDGFKIEDLGLASTLRYRPWYSCAVPDEFTSAYRYGDASNGTGETGIGWINTLDVIAQDLALAGAMDSDSVPGGGLWLVHHQATGALNYTKIDGSGLATLDPDDDGTGSGHTTCTEASTAIDLQYPFFEHVAYNGTPALVVDRTWWSDPARIGDDGYGNETRALRAFAASYYRACGVVEVRATLAYDATADTWSVVGTPEWTELDYDADRTDLSEETVRACKPVPRTGELRGLELDSDGEWLMVFGGPLVTHGTDHTAMLANELNDQGACAIRVGDERGSHTWPDAEAPNPDESCDATCKAATVAVPYHAEQAVSRTLPAATSTILANPYADDLWFGGVIASNCKSCPADYPSLAPYVLQRKDNAGLAAWTWKRLPIDTLDGKLQQPWANELAWGSSEPGGEMDRLYHGAAIGGMWEGSIAW